MATEAAQARHEKDANTLRTALLSEIAAFTVDLLATMVHRDGAEVHLTPTEWAAAGDPGPHRGKLIAQKTLLHDLWDRLCDRHPLSACLPGAAAPQLEPEPARPRCLITEAG